MVEVDFKRPLKLGDLEMGKIFDEIELIIDFDRVSMTTISWQSGIESGREYDMMIFRYDVVVDDGGNVVSVDNIGYEEVYPDDPHRQEYVEQLNHSGLFPTD